MEGVHRIILHLKRPRKILVDSNTPIVGLELPPHIKPVSGHSVTP